MRISKKLREEAAWIAACEASNPDCSCDTFGTAHLIGASEEAADLAFKAWQAVDRRDAHCDEPRGPRGGQQAVSAEAEALLRTGWTP
jgi:hypothetical protein